MAPVDGSVSISQQLRASGGQTLPREQWIMLALVGSSLLINNYDMTLFGLVLPQIQATLHIAEDRIGLYTGFLRLGVLLAFPLAAMADLVGRRRLLFATLIGLTIATALTAFAQNTFQFLGLQSLARCFAYTEDMLCYVIVAEEVAAHMRGWSLGRLAAMGAVGAGLAALVFGLIGKLPGAWRDLYLLGSAGFGVILLARRGLKETRRFEAHRAARIGEAMNLRRALTPVAALLRAYPGRFWALVATTLPFAFGLAPAAAFISKYLQSERHFSPGQVSTLYLLGGGIGLIGYLLAGHLSDRFGRRRVLAVTMTATTVLIGLVYVAPDAWLLAPCWIGGVFMSIAADVTLSALSSELFPTSHRATAAAARNVVNILAGFAGLAAESALYGASGSHAAAIVGLLSLAPLGVVPLLLFIPETAARPLEVIAPEVEIVPA